MDERLTAQLQLMALSDEDFVSCAFLLTSSSASSGEESGEGGIRTLDGGIHPHNALAGRRLQPLGHFSAASAG